MQILASIWDVWTTHTKVAFKSSRTSWNHFFQYQYKLHAKRQICQGRDCDTPTKSSDNVEVELPLNVQHGSKEYWRQKCENYKAKCNQLIKTPISPDDTPGLLTAQKKKIPNPSKSVTVTQVCGSMEGQNAHEKVLPVQDKNKEKDEKNKKEEMRKNNN